MRGSWSCKDYMLQHRGMPGPGNGSGLGSRAGEGYRGFSKRKLGKGIAFEMKMKKISNLKMSKKRKKKNKKNLGT